MLQFAAWPAAPRRTGAFWHLVLPCANGNGFLDLTCKTRTLLSPAVVAHVHGVSVSFAAQSHEKQRLVRLGMRMAIPTLVTPYLMWRRGWISDGIPIARSVLASLPLPFLPIALMAGMIGWGDMQEHWVRAALYLTHRELTERW
jgi:hypothetical protein